MKPSNKDTLSLALITFCAGFFVSILVVLCKLDIVISQCCANRREEEQVEVLAVHQVLPRQIVDEDSHRSTVAAGMPPKTVQFVHVAGRNSNASATLGTAGDEEEGNSAPQLKQKDIKLKTKAPTLPFM